MTSPPGWREIDCCDMHFPSQTQLRSRLDLRTPRPTLYGMYERLVLSFWYDTFVPFFSFHFSFHVATIFISMGENVVAVVIV